MVSLTEIVLVDDLDAGRDGVATRDFCLDGVAYEIELTDANHERLKAALAPFTAVARRLPASSSPHRTGGRPAAGDQDCGRPTRAYKATVRAWWKRNEQTFELPRWRTHGPIPPKVYAAYQDAHEHR